MSVRLSTLNSSTPIDLILVKFYIGGFINFVGMVPFYLKPNKNNILYEDVRRVWHFSCLVLIKWVACVLVPKVLPLENIFSRVCWPMQVCSI